MTIASGGFSGNNALLAFAAVQQGRMNEELTESMRSAETRSQLVKEITDLKSRIQQVNSYAPNEFPQLDVEVQAFMDKYRDVPEAQDIITTMEPYAKSIHDHVKQFGPSTPSPTFQGAAVRGVAHTVNPAVLEAGGVEAPPPTNIPPYEQEHIADWMTNIQGVIDASGTNDQLAMIHMKQLNDNINNSSGMVSGIIESRQNALAQIINNFA